MSDKINYLDGPLAGRNTPLDPKPRAMRVRVPMLKDGKFAFYAVYRRVGETNDYRHVCNRTSEITTTHTDAEGRVIL